MAENIIGGGYLAPAKPFNVINPSGVSSDHALDTLLAVGEGKRQRAFQAQQSASEMDFRQRESERERMFQAEQTAGSQQFQEQQRRKGVESEEYFRTREERFSLMMRDHEDATLALNEEIQLAASQGQWERVAKLKDQQAAIKQQADELGNNINKLTLLHKAKGGIFSKNLKDPNGNSIGAQIITNGTTFATNKYAQFKALQESLRGSVSRLNAPPLMPEEKSMTELVGEVAVPSKWRTPPKKEEPVKTKSGPQNSVTTNPDGSVEPAGYPFPHRETPGGQIEQQTQGAGQWTELATAVAHSASGKSDPTKLAVTVESMFNALERAVADPTEVRGGPFMQKAVEQYKKAVEQGADQDVLDKALYAISMEVKTAASAKDAIEGQNMVTAEGDTNKPVGKVGVSQAAVKLGQMIDWLQVQNDMSPDGQKSVLLKGFGNSPFYDFKTGEQTNAFGDAVVQVMTVLSGAKDPEDFVRKLTNKDTSDDPKELAFVSQLDDDVRSAILKELPEANRQLALLREQQQIPPELEGQNLSELQAKEKDLIYQYQTDLPNQMLQAGLTDTTELRGQLRKGRKNIQGTREKNKASIEKDLEDARRRALQ